MRYFSFPAAAAAALSGVLGLAGTAAQAQPLSSELAGLLNDHPQIRSAAKNLEASRKGVGQARAGFYPTVSTTVSPRSRSAPTTT